MGCGDICAAEFWQKWFVHDEMRALTAFGLKLFWWDRLAKTLILLAGMTLLIDILGEDKLRPIGEALRRRVMWTRRISHGIAKYIIKKGAIFACWGPGLVFRARKRKMIRWAFVKGMKVYYLFSFEFNGLKDIVRKIFSYVIVVFVLIALEIPFFIGVLLLQHVPQVLFAGIFILFFAYYILVLFPPFMLVAIVGMMGGLSMILRIGMILVNLAGFSLGLPRFVVVARSLALFSLFLGSVIDLIAG